MCLATVDETYDKPLEAEEVAWKSFNFYCDGRLRRRKRYHFSDRYFKGTTRVPVGRWLEAEVGSHPLTADNGDKYTSGFHCFKTKKQAEDYLDFSGYAMPVKVRIRKITARGQQPSHGQQSGSVAIALEMMVLPKNKQAGRT